MILHNIDVAFDNIKIFDNFNIEIKDDEVTCILGPSGIGKTTLLNIISNNIKYNGEVKNKLKTAYVFQTPRLINSITIRKNLEFVMDNKDDNKINEILNKLEIQDQINKYPNQLSGGEASRVSIARAILYNPKILLMDEPFKDLDIVLKHNIVSLLKSLIKEKKLGVVYVTHDVDEALDIANRVIVLDSKPVNIKLDIYIGEDRENRDLSSKNINDARQKIYDALLIK